MDVTKRNRIFECEFCEEKFDDSKTLVAHHRIHREDEGLDGVKPSKSSDKSGESQKTFNDQEPIQTEKQHFNGNAALESSSKHAAQHSSDDAGGKSQCDKSFRKSDSLENQNRVKLNSKEKSFTCEYCSKSFEFN